MSENPSGTSCPHCGSLVPHHAPAGLCPRCVLTGAATASEAGVPAASRGQPPTLSEVATAFPDLEILGLIGTGGMGFVYRVRQRKEGREAALKLLPRGLAADPTFVERFNREARTLSRLRHPNIVGVYDFGQCGGFCHLTMELVDGANLRQAMRAGRFTPAQALEIVPRLCEALQYAHSQGVLHRDIKPENILLDAQGRVKIADFGIAKLLDDTGGTAADITLTQTGHRLGTPHYMAPEQIENPATVDHRADIYSLGVVFYELLTGELPLGRFAAPSAKAYVDTRIDDIVFRALAKERELRQQSAGEVGRDVEGLGAPGTSRERGARLRSSRAFCSTPGHLASVAGQLYIYTGSGELVLNAAGFRFTSRGSTTEILFGSIVAMSLGEYPRFTKPSGLNYVAIQFQAEGGIQTQLFTPYRSQWNPSWKTNEVVQEWHDAIRDAVIHRTGRVPSGLPESVILAPTRRVQAFALLICGLGLLAPLGAFLATLKFFSTTPSSGVGGLGAEMGVFLAWIIGPLFGIGFARYVMLRRSGGVDPRESRPRTVLRAFLLPLFLMLAIPAIVWSCRTSLGGRLGQPLAPPPPVQSLSAPTPSLGIPEQSIRLIRTRLEKTADWVILEWDLRSPVPQRFSIQHLERTAGPVELRARRDGAGYSSHLRVVFSKRSDNRGVNLEVSSSETGPLMAVLVEGRVDELLKTAGELVASDLAGLEPAKPVWIAFGGLEQVRLEILKDSAAARPPAEAQTRP